MPAAIRRGAQGEEFERDVRFVQHLHSQFVRVARCVPDLVMPQLMSIFEQMRQG